MAGLLQPGPREAPTMEEKVLARVVSLRLGPLAVERVALARDPPAADSHPTQLRALDGFVRAWRMSIRTRPGEIGLRPPPPGSLRVALHRGGDSHVTYTLNPSAGGWLSGLGRGGTEGNAQRLSVASAPAV